MTFMHISLPHAGLAAGRATRSKLVLDWGDGNSNCGLFSRSPGYKAAGPLTDHTGTKLFFIMDHYAAKDCSKPVSRVGVSLVQVDVSGK